jgi:26S proteasome regulatory subunit T3
MILDQEVGKLGAAAATDLESEEDLYLKMKNLEKQLEILEIQEDAIKEELRNFQSEEIRMKEALKAC